MTSPTPPAPAPGSAAPSYNTDLLLAVVDDEQEQSANVILRHLGNSLVGRIAESTIKTVQGSVKVVAVVSPWGDHNPVVLPCIRVRDVAFMGVTAATGGLFGVVHGVVGDSLYSVPAAYLVASTVVGHAISSVTNDYVSERLMEYMSEVLMHKDVKTLELDTKDVLSFEVTLMYKIYNKSAQLAFFVPPAKLEAAKGKPITISSVFGSVKDYLDYSKGWFNPYLMCTSRLPAIPRYENPNIVICYGPFIVGDYLFAHTVLASTPRLLPLCPPNPEQDVDYTRMYVGLISIAPCRGTMWAHSRRPNEGKFKVLLADGVPGIVIPVKNGCPLLGWDATTLRDAFRAGEAAWRKHAEDILAFLDAVVDYDHAGAYLSGDLEAARAAHAENENDDGVAIMGGEGGAAAADARAALRQSVSALFEAVWRLKGLKVVKENMDASRAGLVFLRFGNRSLFKRERNAIGLWQWRKTKGKEERRTTTESSLLHPRT